MTTKRIAVFVLLALTATGCMPRVSVKPNPGPSTPGIRYYRPKPYLLITPFADSTTTKSEPKAGADPVVKTETKVTGLSDQYVQMELKMLPDFSEEYAINIRTGFGSNHTQLTLQDGWNLTSVNADLDSQTDENIKAVADLVSSVGSMAAKGFNTDATEGTPKNPVVRASNVPLGFYESVIGRDRCGKKQLYGWRYVGFAPFNGCPMQMCGSERVPCDAIELYGLAFQDGIMTFKRIHTLEVLDQEGNYRYEENVEAKPKPKALPAPYEVIDGGVLLEQ